MPERLQLPPEVPPEERHASGVLAEALRQRQASVNPAPAVDPALDAAILGEARRRSEQISASRAPAASGRAPAAGADIGPWLWLGWIAALAGAGAAWWWLH